MVLSSEISVKQQQNILFKKLKKLNNQTKFDGTKYKLWTETCEGRGGSTLVDNLRKALQITLDEYYFDLFQDCVNMMFMAYSILFLALGEVGLHG